MTLLHAEVIGDPISHSKSPLIHGFWLEKLGIDAAYGKVHVGPDGLAAYFAARLANPQWRGCNITLPNKEAALNQPQLDLIDGQARAIGAINTVFREDDGRLHGTNTDIDGVAEAIHAGALDGRIAVVIGAGGAARAAFAHLARSHCAQVRVLARSPEKATRAARECGLEIDCRVLAPESGAFADAALVINATQLGMTGQQAMPGFLLDELAQTADDCLVFDMVYAPLETALLLRARELGRDTADGLTMLIGQAAVAFGKFFGQPAPRTHDAELRALLLR